jgi:hypothetical protein
MRSSTIQKLAEKLLTPKLLKNMEKWEMLVKKIERSEVAKKVMT